MKPTAIVIDRRMAADARAAVRALGGAWFEMFELWHRLSSPYLILVAHTRQRMRLRAPMTFMVMTEESLSDSLHEAFRHLEGRTVQWCLLLESGSSADTVVRSELVRSMAVEGNA